MIDKQDKIDLKVGREVQYMLAGEGWHHVERILRIRAREMEEKILRPYSVARSLAESPLSKEDYQEMLSEQKGALMGLKLALDIPRAIVANADDIMKNLSEPEQEAAYRDD